MESSFFSRKSNQLLGALALFMLIVALGMYAQYTWKQAKYLYSGPTTITVMGQGEVTAVPDIGEFSFSVQEEGADAAVVQGAAAEKVNAIIAYLKEAGVAESDIKTDYYNLSPKYRYEQRVCAVGTYCPPGEQVQDGFVVNQSIRVKVRDLDAAGDLIAAVGERGVSYISGLNFTIDDETALKAEARELAIAEAKAKAKELAKQLGVRLDRMVGYYEDEGGPRPYYGMGGDMMVKSAMEEAAVSPDLPTGENIISSSVNITYQVQ